MKTALKISVIIMVLGLCLGHYNLFAQVGDRLTISGKVTSSEDGSSIPGVTVLEKGTSNGTVTDIDGNYQIPLHSSSSVLVFSYLGYIKEEIPIGNSTSLDVELRTDQQQLNEVVVVGYGTQRRKDLSGSISRITSEEFMQPSTGSFDQMLQGKVPGVQINQTTGAPGGNVNIIVRGVSSITGGNQPLYVIDGYPVDGGGSTDMSGYGGSSFSSENMASNTSNRINPLTSINPSDIESIEILKDASATAIYGSSGSNGVVIITTKRGSYERAQISLDVSHGYQEVANKLDLMNARQYADFVADGRDNAWVYAGGNIDDPNNVRNVATRVRPEFRNPESITTDTDWQDVLFRTAPVSNVQVSSRGGTDKTAKQYGFYCRRPQPDHAHSPEGN